MPSQPGLTLPWPVSTQVRLKISTEGLEKRRGRDGVERETKMSYGKGEIAEIVAIESLRRLTVDKETPMEELFYYQLIKRYAKSELVDTVFEMTISYRVPHTYLSTTRGGEPHKDKLTINDVAYMIKPFAFKRGSDTIPVPVGTKILIVANGTTRNGQKHVQTKDAYYECNCVLKVPQSVTYEWKTKWVNGRDLEVVV